MAVLFYFHAWKLTDTSTPKRVTECEAATRAKRLSETGRKRSTSEERKKKDRGGEPRSAARHTFLGSSRFRWWNRTTGKLCVCASAFMEFQKDKPKTNKETKKKTQRCNIWEKQNGHNRQWKSQWGAIHKWQTSEQWRTAVRTSGSEKVKPSAKGARGRTQETEAKCQLDAAGWLHTAHHRHTLTCVFSTPAWKHRQRL